MRIEKAVKNMKVAMIFQLTSLLLNFIDRKIFIQILGIEYLGVHGLFTNIISMLALAELGVGTAIIYNLYEPLAKGDEKTVAVLMKIYQKLYWSIGLIIGVIGVMMSIALPLFVQDTTLDMGSLRGVYLIFVLGTVGTYWTGYKRSLLYADQKNHMLLVGDMCANTVGLVLKIVVLMLWPSYGVYVVIHMLAKILPNFYASMKVNQVYPYLRSYRENKIDASLMSKVSNNVKDLFVHKISEFVVMSTDNLILSMCVGLQAVGKVANYSLIMTAVLSFVAKGIDALQASMGNLVSTASKEKVYEVYDRLNFLCFWIGSVTAVCLIGLTEPFIRLWIGKEYLLNKSILVVLVLNYVLCVMSRPLWQMMSLSGLFKQDKRNAIAEMSINLIFSIILVQKLGVVGVFVGTTMSYVIAWILKSRLLYGRFFEKSSKKYCGKIVMYLSITVMEVMVTLGVLRYITISNDYIAFGLRTILCLAIPSGVNLMIFGRSASFRYFKERIEERMKEMFKDANGYDKWLTMMICALCLIVPLHGSTLPVGDIVGNVASLLLISISGVYIVWHGLSKTTNPKSIRYGIWAYVGLMVMLCISGMITGGFAGVKVAVLMGVMTCVGVTCALMDWSQLGKRILVIDIGIMIWIIYLLKGVFEWNQVAENESLNFEYIYVNSNFTGMMIALLMMLLMLAYSQNKAKRYLLYIVLLIPSLLETNCRTAVLALVCLCGMYGIWYFTSRCKVAHYGIGIMIIIIIGGVIVIYPNLGSWEGFEEVNRFLGQFSQKDLLSGREKVWLDAMTFIKEKPFYGYGLQVTLQELTGDIYHAHNQFLQIALQGGVIGLALIGSILGSIWYGLYQVKDNRVVRISASIFVGIIVMGLFENTLLGDNIRQGVLQWGMIGIGMSGIIKYYRSA